MSELVIIGFKQPHRASQVLNELRQRDWDWGADLNHAVVVRHDEENRLRVDLSIDPRCSHYRSREELTREELI